jgi:hypothetical protein
MRIVLAILILSGASLMLYAPAQTSGSGRFQLLAAKQTVLGMIDGKAAQTEESVVLKIDIYTGETWRLVKMNVDYKNIEGWRKIETFTGKETFPRPKEGN